MIKPIYDNKNCNNGGMHEYDPYIVKENEIIIDRKWWNSLTPYIKSLIDKRLKYKIEDITIPHEETDINSRDLKILDQCYLDGYDYHIWYNPNIIDGDITMIYIPNSIKRILTELHFHKDIDDKEMNMFRKEIEESIKSGEKYFMRLSSTSGKNCRDIRPMESVEDIINNLVRNDIFVKREYLRDDKDTYLILIPWKEKIEKRYEFRIFVKNGRLVGVSQQWWNEVFNYTEDELRDIEYVFNNIVLKDEVQYTDYIADVYVDGRECKYIEINPYGAHIGAGSALFNWITDESLLNGCENELEIRYMSPF